MGDVINMIFNAEDKLSSEIFEAHDSWGAHGALRDRLNTAMVEVYKLSQDPYLTPAEHQFCVAACDVLHRLDQVLLARMCAEKTML